MKARTAPIPSAMLLKIWTTRRLLSVSGRGDGRMGGGPPARLGNRVVAVAAPGIAPADPAEGQPRAPHRAVRLEGLQAVGRAGWDVTAGRKAGADGAADPAVAPDGPGQKAGGRAHEPPAPARSWAMAASSSAYEASAAAGEAPMR